MRSSLAVILSGFPRRSETFALNELRALEQRGLLGAAFATKPGDGHPIHPGYEPLLSKVQVLETTTLAQQVQEVTRALRQKAVSGIHAYFAHTPSELSERVAQNLKLPFGFSVHAKDARKIPPQELARRARAAACVIACNTEVAAELAEAGANISLLPHGVDSQRFVPKPRRTSQVFELLAVGRLVEKKGFDLLLQAAAQLGFPFHLRIIGDGPDYASLSNRIDSLKLREKVDLLASLSHDELPAAYASADVVVVPSIIDSSGDRDGLPNVVLEAMACARPVIASNVAAISVAVTEATGLLVPERDPASLAKALKTLYQIPELRLKMGQAARARIEKDYDLVKCSNRFCDFVEAVYQPKKTRVLA